MSRRETEIHRTALPLLRRINEGKFTRTDVARKLDVKAQHVTNWLSRGVPSARLPDVAALCGVSTDQYRLEAGLLRGAKARQAKLETAPYLEDFEALPDGLQAYIASRTAQLRALYEGFPSWLRDKLDTAPKDPDQYRAWEIDIETLMARFSKGGPDTKP